MLLRPLWFLGIGAILASCFVFIADAWIPAAIMLSFTAILFTYRFRGKRKLIQPIVSAVIGIAIALRLFTMACYIDTKNQDLIGRTAEVEGMVTETINNTEYYSNCDLKIKKSSISAAEGITVKATMASHMSALPGDTIKATVVFIPHDSAYKDSDFGNGRYFYCSIKDYYSCGKKGFSYYGAVYSVRKAIKNAITSSGNDEKNAVLTSLIIGDKSEISPRLSANVRSAGVSHMLVVSGMHLGIICGGLMTVLKRIGNRTLRITVGLITTVFLVMICLFHVSVMRAGIAYALMLISTAFYRNADGLSSLGLGIISAVMLCPYIFYNVAFLLSVTATFAVIYPSQMIMELLPFRKKRSVLFSFLSYASEIIIISLCSLICTLPVSIYYFGYTALISPITNLTVSFAVTVALISGVIATLLYFIPFIGHIISWFIYFIARCCTGYFITAVNFIGSKNYGVIYIPQEKTGYIILLVVIFLIATKSVYLHKIHKKEERLNA